MVFSSFAFASSNLPIKGTPPPGVQTPIGNIGSTDNTQSAKPMGGGPIVTFAVTGITGTYNGYNWMGWQVSGGPG
jgi:hypothetical protein